MVNISSDHFAVIFSTLNTIPHPNKPTPHLQCTHQTNSHDSPSPSPPHSPSPLSQPKQISSFIAKISTATPTAPLSPPSPIGLTGLETAFPRSSTEKSPSPVASICSSTCQTSSATELTTSPFNSTKHPTPNSKILSGQAQLPRPTSTIIKSWESSMAKTAPPNISIPLTKHRAPTTSSPPKTSPEKNITSGICKNLVTTSPGPH